MTFDFYKKTILVTGAASGIGAYLAMYFYQKGANVILCDIQINVLHQMTNAWQEDKFIAISLDVTKIENWNTVINQSIDKFGSIDIGINSAGIIEPSFILDTPIEYIEKTIDINLKGTMYGSKLLAQHFLENKKGHLINFGSLASLAAVPGLSTYCSSKFGVRGFTLTIAQELAEYGIAVSLICPDAVKTPMLDYQKDKDAAIYTFSGNKYLTVNQVGDAVVGVLQSKEREIWLPKERGITAVLSSLFPEISKILVKMLFKKSKKNQKKW